jgi:hypothetical protein
MLATSSVAPKPTAITQSGPLSISWLDSAIPVGLWQLGVREARLESR